MNNTTNNCAQQVTEVNTGQSRSEEEKDTGYNFRKELVVNFFENSTCKNEEDYSDTPDMTKRQWNKYYKKLGLS